MQKLITKVDWKLLPLLIGLSFLLVASPARAGGVSSADDKKQDSLRAFRNGKFSLFRQGHPGVESSPNPVTGVPEYIYGDLSKGQTKSDPVEAAYEFLEQNKDLYGITDPREELKVKGVAKDKFGAMVDLKQVYRGVDIYQAGMSVHFTSSGKLKGITGGFGQVGNLSTTPTIDSNAATQIAKRDLNYTDESEKKQKEFEAIIGSNRSPVNASLVLASFQNQYHLIWIVDLTRMAAPGGTWVYWVDAHKGAILNKESALMDESPLPVPITRPTPKKEWKKPKPELKKESQDSAPKPKQIEGPRSEGPIEPIPLSPENFGEIPVSQAESIRAVQSTKKDGAIIYTSPGVSPNTFTPAKQDRSSSEESRMVPDSLPVRLEKPIDSIIKDFRKEKGNEEPKEGQKKDSSFNSTNSLQGTLVNITSENFEGEFPDSSPNWYPVDIDGLTNGEYFWDDDDFLPFTGGWSAWCANGGANGLDPQFSKYANNMKSWMLYGPFSLTDATDGHLYFRWRNHSESGFDYFHVRASADGLNYYGYVHSGSSGGWQLFDFDLKNVPVLGDLRGRTGLWIAFIFTSDGSNIDTGAFVDDVVLKKDAPPGTPDLACYTPAGWDNSIVVSCVPGTHTQSQPIVNQPAYIDWAVANIGSRSTSTRIVSRLSVDGIEVRRWFINPPFNPSTYLFVQDTQYVFTIPNHLYTVTLQHDFLDAEKNELDNIINNRCDYTSVVLGTGDNVGTGVGVLNNPQNHIDTRCNGTTFRLEDFTRQLNNDPHGHHGHMADSAYIRTFRNDFLSGFAFIMTDGDNIWDSASQVSGVDAHVYAGRTYTYLDSVLKRNGFDSLGARKMISITDYTDSIGGVAGSSKYDLANHRVLYYEAAPEVGNPSSSGAVEIVAHEWGHGVTAFASNLARTKEPGALNESFSDMLGVAVSYANGDPDYWRIGEDIPQ